MRRLSRLLLAIGFLALFATPGFAQKDAWKNKWYWGAQVGAYMFSTPTQTTDAAFEIGGHWLITTERVGLHMGLSQVLFQSATTSAIPDGTPQGFAVDFSRGRRLLAEVYVFPTDGQLQMYAGGGFVINMITDAQSTVLPTSPQQEQAIAQVLEQHTTKAFFSVTGGFQWRFGRSAMFATYQFIPSGRDFLISSTQHSFTGGLRYALTASSQDVSTAR